MKNLKKIILSVLIFSWIFFGYFFCNHGVYADWNILEIPFSSEDAGLVSSFERDQDTSVELR